MNRLASSHKYAIASVLVVMTTLLIDYVYLQSDSRLKEPDNVNSAQTKISESNASSKLAPQLKRMALVDIQLPLPPLMESMSEASVVLEQQSATVIPKSTHHRLVSETKKELTNQAKDAIQTSTNMHVRRNKVLVTQRLNQLMALEGTDRTLYFPTSNAPQILAYMHNCVGIDVGAVQQNNLTLFSHKNRRHSQIVRAANGYKTAQEQALLATYAPNQVLVRLYPQWFDERLGNEIVTNLGKKPLTQLSGHYTLKGETLSLTNITLNHESIEQEWLLSQGC